MMMLVLTCTQERRRLTGVMTRIERAPSQVTRTRVCRVRTGNARSAGLDWHAHEALFYPGLMSPQALVQSSVRKHGKRIMFLLYSKVPASVPD